MIPQVFRSQNPVNAIPTAIQSLVQPTTDSSDRCEWRNDGLFRNTCAYPRALGRYCIFHAPKTSTPCLATLQTAEAERERLLVSHFGNAIRLHINRQAAFGSSVSFGGFIFPSWSPVDLTTQDRAVHLDFSYSIFLDEVSFSGIEFAQEVRFSSARFCNIASFLTGFSHGARFDDAVFEHSVTFAGAHFAELIDFNAARFYGSVTFDWATVAGRLWIAGSDDVECFAQAASFKRLVFLESGCVDFEHLSLANASFLYTEMERLRFTGVRWHLPKQRIGLSARRRALSDEFVLTQPKEESAHLEAVADNYRELVLNHERKRDFESAESFHIGEMETRRKKCSAGQRPPLRWLLRYFNAYAAYGALSYYGTSYWQALLVLACMFIVFSTLLPFGGLTATNLPYSTLRWEINQSATRWTASQFLREWLASATFVFSSATFQADKAYRPSTDFGRILASCSSLVLAGQAALLLLAIRRKFRR